MLALYGAAAALPPLACHWLLRELHSGSGPHSGMGTPLVLAGLAFAGVASLIIGMLGTLLVVYGVVRLKMLGSVYLLCSLTATVLAVTPAIMGWNEVNEPPPAAFDPGDCTGCAVEGKCALPWGSASSGIMSLGECRSGRRHGLWIFRDRDHEEIASFAFADGVRHGPFETQTIRGAFANGVRDGDWLWRQFGRTVKQGLYVDGRADGRWTCFRRDREEELSWVLFERGRVVEGTGALRVRGYIELPSEAAGKLVPDGIFCEDPGVEPSDMLFGRMF